MSHLTNPELLQLLACPDCGGELSESVDGLRCPACSSVHEIRNGIPLLYPAGMNTAHLHEEEHLAEKMKSSVKVTTRDKFSFAQWNLAKSEFWSMVQSNIRQPRGTYINIGCGYDNRFRNIEEQGNLFVNFDIVYNMLHDIQNRAGGRSCVAGDINKLPFRNGSFDYVISMDVIHHESNNLPALLRSFRDLLKPGGTLFLEDPNAWGLFQIWKTLFLPRPLHRYLRSTYHRLKRSIDRPADYEFATSVWHVASILEDLGFRDLNVHPHTAYPCTGRTGYRVYQSLGHSAYVRKYHNYHYMLSAVRY